MLITTPMNSSILQKRAASSGQHYNCALSLHLFTHHSKVKSAHTGTLSFPLHSDQPDVLYSSNAAGLQFCCTYLISGLIPTDCLVKCISASACLGMTHDQLLSEQPWHQGSNSNSNIALVSFLPMGFMCIQCTCHIHGSVRIIQCL